jgi:Periplasmic serine proteases (ClpP class)
MLKDVLQNSYEQFLQDVSKSRNLPLTTKEKWAEGKIFTGTQARALGLIDAIGSPFTAVQVLRDRALIDEKEEIIWIKPPEESNFSKIFGINQQEDEESPFSTSVSLPDSFSSSSMGINKLMSFLDDKLIGKRIC